VRRAPAVVEAYLGSTAAAAAAAADA
jgi:hypothetical protein